MNESPPTALLAHPDPLALELRPDEPLATVTGDPRALVAELYRDDVVEIGVWEVSPGVFAGENAGFAEQMHVLSGEATVTSDDGTTVELRPGVSFLARAGWRGRWEVRETLRKTYVIWNVPDRPVTEIGALTQRFLAAVSFEPGERPRYDTIRDLFVAEGLLIRNSSDSPEISTVDEFIQSRQQVLDSGALTSFREVEIGDRTEAFGNVAHRFSTYEKRGTLNGSEFAARGAIATQFIRTPGGWRISSMAWDDERPGLVLPDRYR